VEDAPEGTVMELARVALKLDDMSETMTPPDGAGVAKVTVPVEGLPPRTDVGFMLRPVTGSEFALRVALADVSESDALIVAE
jgi:hypothetical protein